jgi:hypothetical protein
MDIFYSFRTDFSAKINTCPFNLSVSCIPAKKHAGMTSCFYIIYDIIPIHLPVIPAFMFMQINLKS